MAIKNAEIQKAYDDYIANATAKSDKTVLASDLRDLVEALVAAQTHAVVRANLVYNANGLFIRKGVVRWMGSNVAAPFTTLETLVLSENVSTLKTIIAEMTNRLTIRDEEE